MTYIIEVETSTHDALRAGITALPRMPGGPDFTVVVVSADEVRSDGEAVLVACQVACCTSRGMATAARLISWAV